MDAATKFCAWGSCAGGFCVRCVSIVGAALLATMAGASTGAGAAPLNVLFYGNSYTTPVRQLVADLAVLAGRPRPNAVDAAVPTVTLQHHLENNTAVIASALPPGESWDYVVLQDQSLQPTRLGNLAQHVSSALALYDRVAEHSPGVTAVMYQTWARSPGHYYYAGPTSVFPGGPSEMHQEVHDGYRLSTARLNDARGAGTAVLAPAGDAWAIAGYPRSLYDADLHHPSYIGSLLSALTLYAAIYEDPGLAGVSEAGLAGAMKVSGAIADTLVASVRGSYADPLTPIEGDYNSDGSVDAADYTLWRDDVGRAIGTLPNDPHAGSTADPIDDRQRGAWATRYGTRGGWRPPVATPEPSAALLGLAAVGALASRRSEPR